MGAGCPVRSPLGRQGVVMLTNKTKVLLVLTQDVLDRARVFAGKATTALKLPVSLQIVLRALIEVGLKRDNHPALRANVEGQAKAVRHPEDQRLGKETAMSKWMWLTVLAAGVAMVLGCAQQPSGTVAMIEDKTYTVTPAAVTVKAGIVTGEVTEMKVTERVEKGSDRVVSPAKLTGMLKLKNTSANQTVRLVAGKILYIDAQGQPIKLEESRTEPVVKFATYGSERLDPGQDATQSLDVECPAEALRGKKLKEIRLELAYIPSPYREERINFTVSIRAGK